MIGLLLLMGIVKKNSIILVDYANQLRERGHGRASTAMRKAGPVRLRPILMTSIATHDGGGAGGAGARARRRDPRADGDRGIGGLVVSTALSLLVVPAFYVVADRAVPACAACAVRNTSSATTTPPPVRPRSRRRPPPTKLRAAGNFRIRWRGGVPLKP